MVAIARAGDDRNHPYVDAIFPKPQRVADDLPPAAQRFLKQARETIHAPDASAVMAASAVDAMLKARGYVEGTLNSRIAKAVDDHVLTTDMGQWAHSVRLESNRPRHADAEDPHVSDDEAKRSIAFAEALAQFLFVLPAMIQRGIAEAND